MQITCSGKLIHLFESTPRANDANRNPEQRFSLQILTEPKKGAINEQAELRNFKIPKGTNPNHYEKSIGSQISVNLKQWQTATGSGFFIEDVRDIHIDSNIPKAVGA